MRKLLLVAAACAFAVPAVAGELRSTEFSSQGVYIDGPGVGVRVGPGGVGIRDRDHDRRRHWRDREVRGDRGCKTVTVRETLPSGRTVSRTRSSC